MPNPNRIAEVFKLAAREAKANRVASMTLKEQTAYILLVAGRQARDKRQYALALDYQLAYRICRLAPSMKDAWSALQEDTALEVETSEHTPASNTGVTEPAAAVPLEYFTRGK